MTRNEIWRLTDGELVTQMAALDVASEPPKLERQPPLTEWEKSFVAGVQAAYVTYGGLTYLQRRSARALLIRVYETLKRRARVDAARTEALRRVNDVDAGGGRSLQALPHPRRSRSRHR